MREIEILPLLLFQKLRQNAAKNSKKFPPQEGLVLHQLRSRQQGLLPPRVRERGLQAGAVEQRQRGQPLAKGGRLKVAQHRRPVECVTPQRREPGPTATLSR